MGTITIELPTDLLKKLGDATGEDISDAVRRGLELLAAAQVQDELMALRGKVKFSLNVGASRARRRKLSRCAS